MLSYKVTYAIQILDLLGRSKRGLSLMAIRDQFLFLPSKTFISETVRQLETGRLICNAMPSSSSKYYLMTNLHDITLKDLVNAIHEELVFDTHAGFAYWQAGFIKSRSKIKLFERHLEKHLMDFMQSVTVGELLEEDSQDEEEDKKKKKVKQNHNEFR